MNGFMLIILLLAAGTWLSAVLGAAIIAFIKTGKNCAADLVLGFAAGVILIVSFNELLHPAIHMSRAHSAMPAWVIVPGAFAVGFFAAFLLDMYIGRLKSRREQKEGVSMYKQGLMLLGALSVHNIPEGLALGVLLGATERPIRLEELWGVIPLVVAIALHKLPEGAAISIAFRQEGMSKFKSFIVGQSSGFFGFVAGVIGYVVAVNINAALPYAMAFAGGAMVWVVVHELIPESSKNRAKRPYIATVGVFLGVLLMLVVDTTLHDHAHACMHSDRPEIRLQRFD